MGNGAWTTYPLAKNGMLGLHQALPPVNVLKPHDVVFP